MEAGLTGSQRSHNGQKTEWAAVKKHVPFYHSEFKPVLGRGQMKIYTAFDINFFLKKFFLAVLGLTVCGHRLCSVWLTNYGTWG